MPYTNPFGIVYDSGDYPAAQDRVLALLHAGKHTDGAEKAEEAADARLHAHGVGRAPRKREARRDVVGVGRERVDRVLVVVADAETDEVFDRLGFDRALISRTFISLGEGATEADRARQRERAAPAPSRSRRQPASNGSRVAASI